MPVYRVAALPASEGCLVLLDFGATKKPTFENLLRVAADGSIVWQAELPDSHDSFVAVATEGTRLVATTWNGWAVDLDPQTGRITRTQFVK